MISRPPPWVPPWARPNLARYRWRALDIEIHWLPWFSSNATIRYAGMLLGMVECLPVQGHLAPDALQGTAHRLDTLGGHVAATPDGPAARA